jgi:hypothetical protein
MIEVNRATIGNRTKRATRMTNLKSFLLLLLGTTVIGCTKPEPEFLADLFIRTEGGSNIKCGLVELYVFDKEAIRLWHPSIAEQYTNSLETIQRRFELAQGKYNAAQKDLQAAKQAYEEAQQRYQQRFEKLKRIKGPQIEPVPPTQPIPVSRGYPPRPIPPSYPSPGKMFNPFLDN